ncbi:MAG: nickel-binding protein [Ginsengibacter sp.]
MPIYMDRHELSQVTAEDVAKVHQEDIKIQDRFGCRGLTYWFDEKRGTAFCLIEAPEESAVKEMHNCAHGMIPTDIIEVDAQLVTAFLGRIDNPSAKEESELIIREPGLRTILVTNPGNISLLKAKVGKEKALSLLTSYKQLTRAFSKKYDGREVNVVHDCFTLSFQNPENAVSLAKELQEVFSTGNQDELSIKIGISAGDPVKQSPELFGEAIQLAKRLCALSTGGQIIISAETMDQLNSDWMQELQVENIKQLNSDSERFLNELIDITESMWDKTDFNIHQLERKLGMSKAQLYRKITAVSDFSPNEFIKEFRLKKALEALSKQSGNVSEVAYSCGFASPSYFSKCFLERFGILPSSLARSEN